MHVCVCVCVCVGAISYNHALQWKQLLISLESHNIFCMLFPLTKGRDFTNSLDKVGQERAKAHTHIQVKHYVIYTTFFNNVMNTVTGIHQHFQASGLPIIYNSVNVCIFNLGINIFMKYCQKL